MSPYEIWQVIRLTCIKIFLKCALIFFLSRAWNRPAAWYGLSALSYDCPKKVFPDTDWPHWDITVLKSFADMMCQTCIKKLYSFSDNKALQRLQTFLLFKKTDQDRWTNATSKRRLKRNYGIIICVTHCSQLLKNADRVSEKG